jgi:hypothetical protein
MVSIESSVNLQIEFASKQYGMWCSLMAESLPIMSEALGSIPTTASVPQKGEKIY